MDASINALDHDKICSEIADYITGSTGHSIISVEGPSGSGKTWMLQQLSEKLIVEDVAIIYLHGEEIRKKEAYYPLSVFVEKREKIKKTGKNVFYSVLSEIPIVGKPLKALIESIDTNEIVSQKLVNDITELKHHFSFSLRLITLLRKYKQVIVLCENFIYFDPETISYLIKLETGINKLLEHYSLCVVLDGTEQLSQKDILEIDLRQKKQFVLTLPTRDQIPAVLLSLGLKLELSTSVSDLIYTCSGGNLALIKIIADYLNDAKIDSESFNQQNILDKVINYRLDRTIDRKIEPILNSIANIGNQMSKTEVVCLSNNSPEILDILGIAESLEFIYLKENYVHFRHEVIRKAFETRGKMRKHETYNKLSECIKKLSPYNYVRRALLEKANDNFEQADILWFLVAIEKFRAGLLEEGIEIVKNFTSDLKSSLKDALFGFKECYSLTFEGKAAEVLVKIEEISNSIPLVLQAEKCCLQCENLSKRIDLQSKRTMLEKLSVWSSLREEEPVLWYRIMQLKILAASELHLDDIAKSTEFEIINYYSKRITFDSMANTVLNRIDLYSELIYTPEIAHKKLVRVEEKVSQEVAEEQFDKAIDLYIARVNLSSNCLLLGMYDKAVLVALSAIRLVKELPNVQFSYPELPLNNMYLAGHFNGTIEIKEVLSLYKNLIDTFKSEEDYVLMQTNFAGLLLRNGDIKLAYDHLSSMTEKLDPDNTDTYYYYYFKFNHSLLGYLMGNTEQSLRNIRDLEPYVDKVYQRSTKYYRKHYEIVLELLNAGKHDSYSNLEKGFSEKQSEYSSTMWNKFKYVYLFTDLQIWTSF